jgi:UDP-N-acetylglucosamine acyltransferase
MKIHPTAVVESGAVIGSDVTIGPYSVIGPLARIGDGTTIQSHVVIDGAVEIGRENLIGHACVIGAAPQDLGFKPETHSSVRIGDGNIIREHCTIHRDTAEGTATVIGNRNFLMASVHVGHNSRIGSFVIIANSCLLGGYVEVDDRAFLGGGTTFHQFVHVGRLVITQGSSGFGKDIPPFLLAAERNLAVGVNVVGLRRAGFTAAEREEVKRAFKLLYRSGLNIQQALARAAETDFGPLGREFFEFAASAKKRGIVAYRHSAEET